MVRDQGLGLHRSSARLPRSDVQDEKRVPEFVCDFHFPIVSGLQCAIEALKRLTRHHGGFLPCGMLIRKLLAFLIDVNRVVVDVKEVSRHGRLTTLEPTGSRFETLAQ
jgi:hypothetical protein